jgi:hypothetical protein
MAEGALLPGRGVRAGREVLAMVPAWPKSLPQLKVSDFGTGRDHVAETHCNRKVFALLHRDDPARQILPNLLLAADDPSTYLFVHGGLEVSRFENRDVPTHEIPDTVVAQLLVNEFGSLLQGLALRAATCFGNLLRPPEAKTLVQRLAGLVPQARFEAYHGLVILDVSPARIRLGSSIRWDATGAPPGPIVAGAPETWEPITP